jgi:hypothetical protein
MRSYEEIMKKVHEDINLCHESEALRKAGETKYWYKIIHDYCPVCGSESTGRWRLYTPRPDSWQDRHEYNETYDYCEM